MCERTYVGCPHCREPADGELRHRELSTECIKYHLDVDGEVDHNVEAEYSEGHYDTTDDGYECNACGWVGSSLDEECSSEDCECRECDEPDPTEEGDDPEELVLIVRRHTAGRRTPEESWPIEAKLLYGSRANWCLAAPRWRVAELSGMSHFFDLVAEFPDEIPSGALELEYDHDERKVLAA